MKSNDLKVVIIHNNDFLENDIDTPLDTSLDATASRADVKNVAFNIYTTLKDLGYKNISIMPIDSLDQVEALAKKDNIDVIFNLCESLDCDPFMEIKIAEILKCGIARFTGNSSRALKNCLDKYRCSKLLNDYGAIVPKSCIIKSMSDILTMGDIFKTNQRLIIKPNAEDGSTGIDFNSVVDSTDELIKKYEMLISSCGLNSFIVQEYIEGEEFNLSILNPKEKIWGLSQISFKDLDPHLPKIVNYAAKWDPNSIEFGATPSVRPTISDNVKNKILENAWKACDALGLDAYARIDFRVCGKGIPYIIDVNPNCDLGISSGFANSFKFLDISYYRIIQTLINNAHYPNNQNFYTQKTPPLTPIYSSTDVSQ